MNLSKLLSCILASHLILPIMSIGLSKAYSSESPVDAATSEIMTEYITVQEALASDSLAPIPVAARAIIEAAGKLSAGNKGTDPSDEITREARKLAAAQSLKDARASFKKLSLPIVRLQRVSKAPGLEIAYCPMAGARWVQRAGKIKNPYFGQEMLECGEKSE